MNNNELNGTPNEIYESERNRSRFSDPRFKHGALATAITAVVLVLIILLNVAFSLISDRVDMRFDISANHLFTLTDEAAEYFEGVSDDITITVLSSRTDLENFSLFRDNGYDGRIYEAPLRRLPEILSDIAKNEHITVNYVDTEANPTFLNKYKLISAPSTPEMYMLVESEKRYKLVDMTEFIITDYGEDTSYSAEDEEYTYYYFSEQVLINAVGYVTRDTVTTVMVINGHGERTEDETNLSAVNTIFENNGLAVDKMDFATDKIPDGTKFLALFAPQRDFSEDEITKLDEFLQNGKDYGRNLFFFDGGTANLTNLYTYLELNWGVKINPDTRVYDSENCLTYAVYPIAAYNEDSDICKELSQENIKTILMNPSPIEIIWEQKDIRTVAALLTSNDTAFTRAADNNMTAETAATITKNDSDVTGTYNLMTLSRKRNENLPVEESTSVLVTSAGFIDFALYDSGVYGNSALITNIIESMQEESDPVTIIKKDLTTEAITLSSNQIKAFALVLSIAFPLLIAAVGIVVFVKRKNL